MAPDQCVSSLVVLMDNAATSFMIPHCATESAWYLLNIGRFKEKGLEGMAKV